MPSYLLLGGNLHFLVLSGAHLMQAIRVVDRLPECTGFELRIPPIHRETVSTRYFMRLHGRRWVHVTRWKVPLLERSLAKKC